MNALIALVSFLAFWFCAAVFVAVVWAVAVRVTDRIQMRPAPRRNRGGDR